MQNEELESLIAELIKIQEEFYHKFKVKDIYTNSKFFEILVADSLNHELIPGHSGSRDAKMKKAKIMKFYARFWLIILSA